MENRMSFKAIDEQAPKFCTLLVTISCYHYLDLTAMITRIVQNILEKQINLS